MSTPLSVTPKIGTCASLAAARAVHDGLVELVALFNCCDLKGSFTLKLFHRTVLSYFWKRFLLERSIWNQTYIFFRRAGGRGCVSRYDTFTRKWVFIRSFSDDNPYNSHNMTSNQCLLSCLRANVIKQLLFCTKKVTAVSWRAVSSWPTIMYCFLCWQINSYNALLEKVDLRYNWQDLFFVTSRTTQTWTVWRDLLTNITEKYFWFVKKVSMQDQWSPFCFSIPCHYRCRVDSKVLHVSSGYYLPWCTRGIFIKLATTKVINLFSTGIQDVTKIVNNKKKKKKNTPNRSVIDFDHPVLK